MTSRPSRRVLVGGSVAALAAACTGSRPPAAPARADPDVALRAAAAAREQALIAAYDTAGTTPALRTRLAPLRAEHAVHLQALGVAGPPAARPSTAAGLAQLAALERRTAAAHAAAAVDASPALAAVLASLAASEASHAVVL